MSKASELKSRVLARMEQRGLTAYKHNEVVLDRERYLAVHETFKHNDAEENVTVTIYCCVPFGGYAYRVISKIRVPKNASDKVIDKRLDEAEKFLKEVQ